MKRLLAVALALACGVTAVLADTDPIAERRALMKHDGEAAKKLFDMSKGKIPFDLATVKESLKTLDDGATKSAALFPDNSKTGGGTAALAGDLGEQSGFRRPFRPIRQGCPSRPGRHYGRGDVQAIRSGRLQELRQLPRTLQGQKRLRLAFSPREFAARMKWVAVVLALVVVGRGRAGLGAVCAAAALFG